jgi:hypothetical protein
VYWNGRKWSQVHVPDPGGPASTGDSDLFGVSCPAPDMCWAVGSSITGVSAVGTVTAVKNQVLHWNGRRWSLVAVPEQDRTRDQLKDVSCSSPVDCWAVGSSGNAFGNPVGIELNQALHWNGSNWSTR